MLGVTLLQGLLLDFASQSKTLIVSSMSSTMKRKPPDTQQRVSVRLNQSLA